MDSAASARPALRRPSWTKARDRFFRLCATTWDPGCWGWALDGWWLYTLEWTPFRSVRLLQRRPLTWQPTTCWAKPWKFRSISSWVAACAIEYRCFGLPRAGRLKKTQDAVTKVREGYRTLGIKVAALPPERDVARIKAIRGAVGPYGTVLLSTFTGARFQGDPSIPPVFDSRLMLCWTGRIAETLRKRPDAVRSIHPTYSVAAIGADAVSLTQDTSNPFRRVPRIPRTGNLQDLMIAISCPSASATSAAL
jgi:hypothetical protein